MALINETKSAEAKARLESPGRAKAHEKRQALEEAAAEVQAAAYAGMGGGGGDEATSDTS